MSCREQNASDAAAADKLTLKLACANKLASLREPNQAPNCSEVVAVGSPSTPTSPVPCTDKGAEDCGGSLWTGPHGGEEFECHHSVCLEEFELKIKAASGANKHRRTQSDGSAQHPPPPPMESPTDVSEFDLEPIAPATSVSASPSTPIAIPAVMANLNTAFDIDEQSLKEQSTGRRSTSRKPYRRAASTLTF